MMRWLVRMSKGVASTFLDGTAAPLVVSFGQLERHPYRTTKTIQDRSRAGDAPKPTSTPAPMAARTSISSIGKVSVIQRPSCQTGPEYEAKGFRAVDRRKNEHRISVPVDTVCSSSISVSPWRGCGAVTGGSREHLARERPQRDDDMNSLNLATSENIC